MATNLENLPQSNAAPAPEPQAPAAPQQPPVAPVEPPAGVDSSLIQPSNDGDGGTPNAGPDDSHSSFADYAPGGLKAGQSPEPGSPPQEPGPAWTQPLTQAGIDTSGFKSEADLANAYVQQQQQMKEMSQYAQYGRDFLPHAQQFQQYMRGQQQPQQPAAETPAPEPVQGIDEKLKAHWEKLWNKPEYDPSWDAMVKVNTDTGMYEGVSPYVPAQVVQGMNSHREWQRTALQKMLNDPYSSQWEAMKPGIEDTTRQIIKEELASRSVAQDFENIERQYEGVLYEMDPQGQRVTDPFTGQNRYTAFGEHVVGEMQRLYNSGVTDPYTNWEYAVSSAKAMLYDTTQQPAAPGQVPPTQQPQPGLPQAPQQQPGLPQPTGYVQPYQQQPGQVPQQPAAPSMYHGMATGMNGQLPAGGGFTPSAPANPQQSFLDRARNNLGSQDAYGQQPLANGEPPLDFSSEEFFTRIAAQQGLIPSQ